jgi:nucleoside phosphorylase
MMFQPPARLLLDEQPSYSEPQIPGLPGLEPIDWTNSGLEQPTLLETPSTLPPAQTVVIAWADPEWAALHHVFCESTVVMPRSEFEGPFAGWREDTAEDASGATAQWGSFRLTQIGDTTVLLYKSRIHLHEQGASRLTELAERLIASVKPELIISTGTAGGANSADHVGTVALVKAATLYGAQTKPATWPTYASQWAVPTARTEATGARALLVPIPVTPKALDELAKQVGYPLQELDPLGLSTPGAVPAVRNLSGGTTSLLTAATFLVGTIDNKYKSYACIEMDDAIVADACVRAGIQYGSVRNISDSAQNPQLPPKTQEAWGGVIYDTYGPYTSLNGAIMALAAVS